MRKPAGGVLTGPGDIVVRKPGAGILACHGRQVDMPHVWVARFEKRVQRRRRWFRRH